MIRIRSIAELPNALRDVRKMHRLTQRQLGEVADVKQGRISEFEIGKVMPATPTLFTMAHALGYDLALIPREEA